MLFHRKKNISRTPRAFSVFARGVGGTYTEAKRAFLRAIFGCVLSA